MLWEAEKKAKRKWDEFDRGEERRKNDAGKVGRRKNERKMDEGRKIGRRGSMKEEMKVKKNERK